MSYLKVSISLPESEVAYLEQLRMKVTIPSEKLYPSMSDLYHLAVLNLKKLPKSEVVKLLHTFWK